MERRLKGRQRRIWKETRAPRTIRVEKWEDMRREVLGKLDEYLTPHELLGLVSTCNAQIEEATRENETKYRKTWFAVRDRVLWKALDEWSFGEPLIQVRLVTLNSRTPEHREALNFRFIGKRGVYETQTSVKSICEINRVGRSILFEKVGRSGSCK